MLLNVKSGDEWHIVRDKTTNDIKLENVNKKKEIMLGKLVSDGWTMFGAIETVDIILKKMDAQNSNEIMQSKSPNECEWAKASKKVNRSKLRESIKLIWDKHDQELLEKSEFISLGHGDHLRISYHAFTKNLQKVNIMTVDKGDYYWSC